MTNKRCPKCNSELKEIDVSVEGAIKKVKSLQCKKCNHLEFDQKTGKKVVEELKEKADLKKSFGTLGDKMSGQEFKDMVRKGWTK